MSKKKILVVDDEPTNIRVIGDILSPNYQVKAANSGENALKILESNLDVSLILLDIMMPEMDGYEVCRIIKNSDDTKQIPVIIVSALTSIEEQMQGFEVGAEDYLAKPVNPEILLAKIENAMENVKRMQELDFAQNTAMTALQSLNEMGKISQYFCSLLKTKSVDKIVKILMNLIQSYSLSAVLRISLNSENIVHSSTHDIDRPIELSLLDNLVNKGDIYSFKTATVFNQSIISLLVTNMPVENEEFYGRLKDNFHLLVAGTNAAIEEIINEKKLLADFRKEKDQSLKLTEIIESFDSVLEKIKEQQSNYMEATKVVVSDLVKEMEDAFIYLALSEHQEEDLLARVNKAFEQIKKLVDRNCVIEEEIEHIKNTIKTNV
ncbi:MAG: response regulator [Gammaproteobacteria bacterium]|nr:response regulator [Gammaproteobacteria bacterium]